MVKGDEKTPKCLGTMNRIFHNLHLLSLPSPALQQAAAHIRLLFQYVATCSFVQHFFSSFFASEVALHLQHPRQISVTCLKNPYCLCLQNIYDRDDLETCNQSSPKLSKLHKSIMEPARCWICKQGTRDSSKSWHLRTSCSVRQCINANMGKKAI